MNEPAVRVEEQIISLFPNLETEIYQGWVLRKEPHHMLVYPLYGSSDQNIAERIQACEEISSQNSLSCQFRIAEHSNYHLVARLEDNGYKLWHSYIIGERYMNEGTVLPNQNPHRESGKAKAILRKVTEANITEKIVAKNGLAVGIKRQELLYLPKAELPYDVEMDDIFRFSFENHISRILVNIPENEKLLAYYREAGFHEAYLYRCYQKED